MKAAPSAAIAFTYDALPYWYFLIPSESEYGLPMV